MSIWIKFGTLNTTTMARTVQECNDYLVTQLVAQLGSIGITINPNTWSARNLLRAVCYTFAVAQSLSEQLQDIQIAKMQEILEKSASGSAKWLQDAVFRFQYSAATPQYLTNVGGVVEYPIVIPSLRIVTACSVTSNFANQVLVKVAKGTTLTTLTSPEVTALQAYVLLKGTAGISYVVSSTASDKIRIEGSIYYQGIYASVINTNVITALNTYLANLSKTNFGGDIKVSDLETLIRQIEGVNDVVFERVSCRLNSQTVLNGVDLVLAGDWVLRKYTSGAGYLVEETTASHTFTDTLTFIAE